MNVSLNKYHIAPDNIPSPFIALLLQQDNKKILIDTGIGFSEKPINVRGNSVLLKGIPVNAFTFLWCHIFRFDFAACML